MGVGLIAEQFKVVESELIDFRDLRINLHFWKWKRLPAELEIGLLQMVRVKVEIAKGVYEFARFVTTNLRHHHGEEGIGGDVKWDSQEKIGAALVKLAAQTGTLGIGIVDVELKEKMAGWKSHFIHLADVPGRNEVAARGRIVF